MKKSLSIGRVAGGFTKREALRLAKEMREKYGNAGFFYMSGKTYRDIDDVISSLRADSEVSDGKG